jgi:metallothiol transferase
MIPTFGLNHLTLRVADLERSIAFYRDLLGFALRWRSDISAYLEGGGHWLSLLERRVGPAAEETAGMDHFALAIAEEAFDSAVEELQRRGVKIVRGPLSRVAGRSVYFHDPDGIVVELHTSDLHARLQTWQG